MYLIGTTNVAFTHALKLYPLHDLAKERQDISLFVGPAPLINVCPNPFIALDFCLHLGQMTIKLPQTEF